MPASPWLARLLARARRSKSVRPRRSGGAPAPLRLEWLEERLAPAFNLTLVGSGATSGVTRSATATTATYEATAAGATLNWNDISGDLVGGLNVVVTSGTTGAEAGNIADTSGAVVNNAAGTSLTVQSGSGANLVGNVTLTDVRLSGAGSAVKVSAANNVAVGTLDGLLASAELTTSGGAISGGTVVATDLLLQSSGAIGSAGTPFLTRVDTLRAKTTANGSGIFLTEADSLTLQSAGGVNGIDADNGPISLATTDGDLDTNGARIGSLGAPITVTVGGIDRTFTNQSGRVENDNTIAITADRMVLGSQADAIVANTGLVTLAPFTASRPIDLGSTSDPTGSLNLSSAELGTITTTGGVAVGSAGAGAVTVSATIARNGQPLTVRTGAGVTGSGDIINGSATAATLTIDQAGSSTYSGRIGGPSGGAANDKNLSFVKQGAGVLTLTGSSTYTGATTVSDGGLIVNGTSGTGAHTVASGATLSGTGTVGGSLTVQAGGTVRPGAGSGGTLAVNGSVSLETGSTFLADLGPGTAFGQLAATGSVLIGQGAKLLGAAAGSLDALSYPLITTAQITIQGNGFVDGNGTSMPPLSGGPVVVGGRSFNYEYTQNAFTLFQIPTTAVALDGSGNLDVTTTGALADTLAVSRNGANLRVRDPNQVLSAGAGVTQLDAHTVELPFANITGELRISTAGGDDLVTLNLAGGGVIPVGGIVYDGGAGGNDKLSVKGSGTQTAVYTPSATTNGDGTVVVDGRTITFSGLEPVDMSGMALATVSLPNADDVLNVVNGFDFATGTIPALVVSGTSGGVGIESVALWNNGTVLITTAGTDGADTVTITSANNAHNNTNLVVDTGTNSDTLTVAGPVAATGDIKFFSTTITVNGNINSTAGGDIALQATDSGSTGDKLTINNDVNTAGGSGTISLVSQEDLVQNADVFAGGAGDVAAVANGSLTMSATATTFSGGGNIVYRGAAGLAVGSFTTTGGVGLESALGAITDANGAATNVSAASLVMVAGAGVGAGDALEAAVASLAASAQGDVAVTNTGALDVTDVAVTATTSEFSTGLSASGVASAAGGVALSADSVSLLKPITAVGTVTLTATVGGISVSGAGPHVTAAALALSAVTGIGGGATLEMAVANVEARTATGDILLFNTGDLTVGGVTAALSGVQVTGATGEIILTTAGSLLVNITGDVVLGPADVSLTAGVDIQTGGNNGFNKPPFGAVGSTGGATSLVAARDVIIGDAANNKHGDVTGFGLSLTAGRDVVVTADSLAVARGTGNLVVSTGRDARLAPPAGVAGPAFVTEGGSMTATVAGDFIAAGGNTTFNGLDTQTNGASGGDITIDAANIVMSDFVAAGHGTVRLTATVGSITDPSGPVNRIDAGALIATAVSGIQLDTEVETVTASVTGAGGISLNEFDGLDVLSATTANGPVTITANGAMRVRDVVAGTDAPANSVVLTTATGDMTVEVVTAGLTTSATLTASTGSIFDDGVNTTRVAAGSLFLTAVRAIGAPGATGQIDTAVTQVEAKTTGAGPFSGAPTPGIWIGDVDDLIVNNTSTGDGVILIDAGANLDARSVTAGGTGRNLRLQALGGNLTVGVVSAADDTALLTATGAITDGNATGADVTAARLGLKAGAGIGAGDALETAVTTLAWNSGTGGIELANVGDLTVNDVGAFGQTVFGGSGMGGADVSSTLSFTVATGVSMNGDITFTAGEVADFPTCANDLTVNTGVLISSTLGAITLRAGDDVVVPAGANVQAATALSIVAAFNDLDNCGGAVLDGTLVAGTDLAVCVNDDLSVGTFFATSGTVSLRSMNGAILDGNVGGTNVFAQALAMRANTGIGVADAIETKVARLEAETTTGGIFVVNVADGGVGTNLAIGGVTPDACVGPLTGVKVLTSGDIQIDGSGDIVVDTAGDTVAGPGNISLIAQGVLTVSQNVTSTAAADGAVVTLTGNGGVTVNNAATVANSNGKAITLAVSGTGSAGHEDGVDIDGATLDVGGGALTITGTGGAGGGDSNVGVFVHGAGTRITSAGGAIQVNGTGGGAGGGNLNHGVVIASGASVSGIGTASVTVVGVGGNGNSAGVEVDTGGASVTTVDGALTITGTALNAGITAFGIDVFDSGMIRSTGAGPVTLTGTSINPDVTAGIRLLSGGSVQANTGDVTLNAEEMDFGAGTSVTGNAQLFIKPLTAGRGLSLGAAANQAGKLSLTAEDIAAIGSTFTLITIGRDDTTGAATVDGNATFGTDVLLQTPGAGSGGITASATLSVGGNDLVLNSGSNIATTGAGLFQANTLAMFAQTGIGTSGAPVQIMANNVEAKTTTGGVFLHNTGALTVGGVRPDLSGIEVGTSGDIDVSSGGKLTVQENVTTKAGNVRLVARDSLAAGDDLVVLANVESLSGGNLILRAGDDLTINSAATLTTSGTGTILLEVDADNADPGVGGTAIFQGASLKAAAGATALGNGDNDTFNFSPSADTPITVNGNAPLVVPGDILNLDLSGTVGKTLQITDTFTAKTSFTTAKDVNIVSIEDVNIGNGSFNVLLDLSQAAINGVPFGNGTALPDVVRFGVDNAGANLLFDAAQNSGPATGYFVLNIGGARSVSFAGSSDATNFQFAQSASGLLPTFNGVAINSHNDAGQLPPNTFTVNNVGLNWTGGSSGADTLSVLLSTTQVVSYFADLVGNKGGNAEIANAVRMSFQNLGGLTVDGNNGTLLADASLVNATAFTVGGGVNDGLSLIDGDGGFTDVLFGGFNQFTLRGGTGSQTMTLNDLDLLDAALQSLTISGDNVRNNDPAPDFLFINALRGGLGGNFVGGAGDDVFEVVPGSMTIFGDAGANRLVVNGSGTSAVQNVTVSGINVNGGGSYNVFYQAVGGSFANGVLVLTGDGADNVAVNSTAGPTGLSTGGGDDEITVANTVALNTRLAGTLTLDAGEGANSLSVSDVGNSIGGLFDVGSSSLSGAGWRVDYGALNGTFEELIFLAGTGNDLVRVLGVGAAHVVVNAAPGNDTLRVFVGSNNLPTGLEVRGGLGTNSLQTIDTTGGALIRNFPTGPRSGLIQVSYQANTPTGYRYQHIDTVIGINASANYITALYRHILGRNPSRPEINAQIGLLNAQGRLAVVHALETSAAGRTFLVQTWYQMFFGRNPNPAESAIMVQALLSGQSEEAVLGTLLGSPTLPLTAAFRTQMVTSYYQSLLRRQPTAAELGSAVSSAQPLQALRELIEIGEEFFLTGV